MQIGYGEEYNNWLKTLQVGDSFCYIGRHNKLYISDKIVKVTPKGKIRTEKGLTFKSNGYKEVASTWDDSPCIEPLTDEILQFNQRQVSLSYLTQFKFDSLTNDQLEEIVKIIKR